MKSNRDLIISMILKKNPGITTADAGKCLNKITQALDEAEKLSPSTERNFDTEAQAGQDEERSDG